LKFPKYKKQIEMYYANHRNMIKGTFEESIKILNYLKINNYDCYVLSNWSAETFKGMIDDYPFLKKFDGLLISGEDKLIKPDLAIYQLAIKRFDLDPKKCVFIDDRLENIEAAKKLSFEVIHLTDPHSIEFSIKKYLN
jgi:2-haloacid dehalogenase